MAADQRRKGPNGAVGDAGPRDNKARGKKKQVGSLECNGFRVKPHVSLEWDASRRRVVPKREQIGLSWRNLRRFAEPPPPRGHKILADAVDVPTELFKLENLEDVLSYEVWQTCLSERERRYLGQFLPRDIDPQQAVEQLLSGENFHFGNPFLDWAASLQSGNLHPDAVVQRERSLKAEKSAYYVELHRYHNDMIGSLLKIKDRWQSSTNMEKELNQKTMRSRKDKEKKFSYASQSEFHDLDDNLAGMSKSSSLDAEDKTSNSDGQTESFKKNAESRKRISKKRPIKDKTGSPAGASDNFLFDEAKARKGERLKKRNIVYNDGTKYMSYVKISKKQHELAKSMEQSGSCMQSNSLGNLANLQIRPYEVFVEEQRKKLHDHWLRLANHDLPSAYGIWNDIRSQRQQIMRSLGQELLERHDSLIEDDDDDDEIRETEPPAQKDYDDERLPMEEDKESPSCSSQDHQDNVGADYASSMEDDEESIVPGFDNNQIRDDQEVNHQFIAKNHDQSLPCSLQDAKLVTNSMLGPPGMIIHEGNANCVPSSSVDRFLNREPSSSCGNLNFNHGGPEAEILKSGSIAQNVSAFSENLTGGHLIDMDRVPLSQGVDMWQPVSSVSSMPLSYFDSSPVGCQFNSAAELPLTTSLSPIDGEQRTSQWIDLESNLHGQVQQLPRDSNSFVSYPNHRDQNELLQSIFNAQQGMLHPCNSNNQQKHLGALNFQLPNSVLAETYGRRMQNSLQQNMSTGGVLPSGGGGSRYLMQQRQPEHHLLPTSVSVPDWVHHVPSTIQQPPPLPGSNWFSNSSEHQVRGGGWTGSSGGPGQTNNLVMDQSMYGVLPHCNQLPSRPLSYDSMEQFIPSRNYANGLMNGHSIGNVLPHHTAPPLDYMNRRDDDTGWMSLPPHQNSSMNDSIGKPPFLGSWNP